LPVGSLSLLSRRPHDGLWLNRVAVHRSRYASSEHLKSALQALLALVTNLSAPLLSRVLEQEFSIPEQYFHLEEGTEV
jgi:hypothetical protein